MTLRDPKGYITSPPSVVVRVINTSRADINSLLGVAISYNVERERYLVYMAASQSTMALKQENLKKANRIDTYRCQCQQMRNDPRVQEKVAYYMSIARQFVSPFELSRVISVVSISWFYLLLHFGLAKTTLVMSLVTIFFVVMAPDIMSKSPPSATWRNFPRRTKEIIEHQVPLLKGRMTERSAVFSILILCIACLRSLNASKHSTDSIQLSSSFRNDYEILKKYYELGFEDGSNGHSHGASLIPHGEFYANEGGSSFDSAEIVDSSHLEKIGSMSRFASIVYLYQSVVEFGTDQTTNLFSFGQLAANLQHHTKLWEKMVLLLCLYNVLRVYV